MEVHDTLLQITRRFFSVIIGKTSLLIRDSLRSTFAACISLRSCSQNISKTLAKWNFFADMF